MIRTLTASALLLALAVPAVQAEPARPTLRDYRAIDRWVEIFDPGQLVGPQIDPTGPLKGLGHRLEPEPDPWLETQIFDKVVIGY